MIRQTLDKYGLEEADPNSYCLVMRTRYAKAGAEAAVAHEEVLEDSTCPLSLIIIDKPPKGVVTTFEVSSFFQHALLNQTGRFFYLTYILKNV